MLNIKNVAVLGTGVMGSQIAAHCANAGLNVYAFDMKQDISENGIEKATKIKPKAFYDKKDVSLIKCCNYITKFIMFYSLFLSVVHFAVF